MNPDSQDAHALPVRPRHSRPRGRHRDPHSITLPPHPPVLILGLCGGVSANAATLTAELAREIAHLAGGGDQGLQVRSGHVGDTDEDLSEVLLSLGESPYPETPPAVVVPLLTGPHPQLEAGLHRTIDASGVPVSVTGPLGPHPLLAGALHERLAESGLARPDRARQLSITTAADGIIVATSGGPPALQAAQATSVLLASRLTVPAVPAALDAEPGLGDAARQLHEGGAARLAMAPCFLGPEIEAPQLDRAADEVGAQRCDVLGAHPDIAKLVTVRYANALDEALIAAEAALSQP